LTEQSSSKRPIGHKINDEIQRGIYDDKTQARLPAKIIQLLRWETRHVHHSIKTRGYFADKKQSDDARSHYG
jgi:hypothetical protein